MTGEFWMLLYFGFVSLVVVAIGLTLIVRADAVSELFWRQAKQWNYPKMFFTKQVFLRGGYGFVIGGLVGLIAVIVTASRQ